MDFTISNTMTIHTFQSSFSGRVSRHLSTLFILVEFIRLASCTSHRRDLLLMQI